MKKTGIVLTVLSFFSFVGNINSGTGLFGPTLMLAIGIFLIYRANEKKEEDMAKHKEDEKE